MFDLDDAYQEPYAKIKVVRISENEDNALKETLAKECEHAEFIAFNSNVLCGREEFEDVLRGSDLTFIITEDTAKCIQLAVTVAEYVYSVGSLSVGIVEKPIDFEFDDWENCKDENINNFKEKLDTILAISEVRLLPLIKSMYDLIAKQGLINLDFPDLKYILQGSDYALVGSGLASGENASANALKIALDTSSLKTAIKNATRILLKFTGSEDFMGMIDVNEGVVALLEIANPDVNIVFGASIDNTLGENISVTIIVTGVGKFGNEDIKISSLMGMHTLGDISPECLQKDNEENKEKEQYDDLVPHPNGKKVRETLKNMRNEISSLMSMHTLGVISPECLRKVNKENKEQYDYLVPHPNGKKFAKF